jgi:glycopeptide antibiotics resistance protein
MTTSNAHDNASAAHDERRGRRAARAVTLAYVALVLLVSFVPASVDFSRAHLDEQWQMFVGSLGRSWGQNRGPRDLATNFALYVPLGMLLPWTLTARSRWRVPALLAGAALSVLVELAQIPTTRFPSLWDVLSNSAGAALAYLLVSQVRARRHLSAALFVGRAGVPREQLAAALAVLYVAVLGFLALMPYDVSLARVDLVGKWQGTAWHAGRIFADPFAPWSSGRLLGVPAALLLLLPFGFLAGLARARGLARIAAEGALVSLVIETLQVGVRSRTSDVAQVLLAGVGTTLGALLARAWSRSAGTRTRPVPRPFRLRDPLLAALLGYGVFLAPTAWAPFHAVPSLHAGLARLAHESSWVPLAAYMNGVRSLGMFRDLLLEIGLYVPLGGLLQVYLARLARPRWLPRRLLAALAVALFVGAGLELGQAFFVDKWVDTTDILSHVAGALAGYLALSAFSAPPSG